MSFSTAHMCINLDGFIFLLTIHTIATMISKATTLLDRRPLKVDYVRGLKWSATSNRVEKPDNGLGPCSRQCDNATMRKSLLVPGRWIFIGVSFRDRSSFPRHKPWRRYTTRPSFRRWEAQEKWQKRTEGRCNWFLWLKALGCRNYTKELDSKMIMAWIIHLAARDVLCGPFPPLRVGT